jgi:hypothetical protein
MTQGTVKTQGTELYFVDDVTDSDGQITKVACPTGITGLGGPADQIETTCLDSTDAEYVGGLKRPGAITVPINFIPSSPSHQAIIALQDSGQTVEWMIAFANGTTAPTLDTDGAMEFPENRDAIAFDGYVSDFNLDIATNEIVRGTLTIQRSGSLRRNFVVPAPV